MDVGAVSTILRNHVQVLWHRMSGLEAQRDPFCIDKTFNRNDLQFLLHIYVQLNWRKGVISGEVTPYEGGRCPISDRMVSQKRVFQRN